MEEEPQKDADYIEMNEIIEIIPKNKILEEKEVGEKKESPNNKPPVINYPKLPLDLSIDIQSIKLVFDEETTPTGKEVIRSRSLRSLGESKSKQVDFTCNNDSSETTYFSKAKSFTRSLSGKLFFKEFKIQSISNEIKENVQYPNDLKIHKAIKQRISLQKFAKLVKKYQSQINQTDSNLQTPLHLCATAGLINYMRILIRRGANVNLQDMNGFTPLHLSLIGLQLDTCAILLETKKIDIMITNNENTSVLSYLVRVPVDETNVVLYRRILDLLIESGLDVNMQNKHGETALHSTSLRGNIHAAAFLLERGADCNIRNS